MALKLTNLASSRLAQNLTASGTQLRVLEGEGEKFPTIDEPGDWFPLAVVDDLARTEFMRCTARAGDMLTVVRAREGSVARAYSAGDGVELRLTVAAMNELSDSNA